MRVRRRTLPFSYARSSTSERVSTVCTAFASLMQGQAQAQEQLRRSVERDMLTDVLSRRTMMDRIEAAMVTAIHEPVALYFVDLDGFKAVNDRLGHREGDALLVKVAQALHKSVRGSDPRYVARRVIRIRKPIAVRDGDRVIRVSPAAKSGSVTAASMVWTRTLRGSPPARGGGSPAGADRAGAGRRRGF